MRTKGSAAELEQRRRIAARLLEQGMKPIRVAEALGVSPAAVTRWRQAWQKGGEKALAAKPHPGGKPRMTPALACSPKTGPSFVRVSDDIDVGRRLENEEVHTTADCPEIASSRC